MKILFVDDDIDFSQNICETLINAGHIIEYCQNANVAINMIGNRQYDIYIIDLMLPPTFEDEGISLLEEIKRGKNQNKVIMISQRSQNMTSIVDLAYQLGARRFIDKADSSFAVTLQIIIKEII